MVEQEERKGLTKVMKGMNELVRRIHAVTPRSTVQWGLAVEEIGISPYDD